MERPLEQPAGRPTQKPRLTCEATVCQVAAAYSVNVQDLLGPCREQLLVEARRVTMALLYEQGMGVTAIGRLMHRDHSTVVHHLRTVQGHSSPEEAIMLTDLRQLLTKKAS